jgi:hypothetical protein
MARPTSSVSVNLFTMILMLNTFKSHHLLEAGQLISLIQRMLGPRNVNSLLIGTSQCVQTYIPESSFIRSGELVQGHHSKGIPSALPVA